MGSRRRNPRRTAAPNIVVTSPPYARAAFSMPAEFATAQGQSLPP
jgi:hypothetical protein